MNRQLMFLDCPAYLDKDRGHRCGLPAEVQRRFVMNSTDGPLESAMIRCPAGHFFSGPIEFLTYDKRETTASRSASRDRGFDAAAEGDELLLTAGRADELQGRREPGGTAGYRQGQGGQAGQVGRHGQNGE
jgi:hypothetical protein